jgi:hypothetical protein
MTWEKAVKLSIGKNEFGKENKNPIPIRQIGNKNILFIPIL